MKSYAWALLFLIFSACHFGEYEAPVILEQDNFEVDFFRADSALFYSGADPFNQSLVFTNHPEFAQVYIEEIMRFAPYKSEMLTAQVSTFTEDAIWMGVQQELDSVFADTKDIEEQITRSLKRLAEIMPFVTVPRKVFFYNSGFNVAVYPEVEFLGIGLEWFMGKDSEYISMLPPSNYPMYKKNKMQRSHLVSDALRGFLLYSLYTPVAEENVLNTMVFYGKCLFVLEQCSDLKTEQILNYSKEELAWAEDNETNTWKRLVSEEWLFSNDRKRMTQLTNNAPFTAGFPQESPPRLGWYVGYQMLRDYAKNHQSDNLKTILDASAESILKEYKP